MQCRDGCGACCIAPGIALALPGMPDGKPAGVPCINLDMITYRCQIWGSPHYPDACRRFAPEPGVCGTSREDALTRIQILEVQTQ